MYLSLCPHAVLLSLLQANLVCPLLDDRLVKLRLLQTTSTVERITMLRSMLQQLQDVHLSGCSIM